MDNIAWLVLVFLWISMVKDTCMESVCQQHEVDTVIHVCTESTLNHVKAMYLDTSRTPPHPTEIECVCELELTSKVLPISPHTATVEFLSGSYVQRSSFTISAKSDVILNATVGRTFIELVIPIMRITYRQSKKSNDLSCLNITVNNGTTFNASCYTSDMSHNFPSVEITSTATAPLPGAQQTTATATLQNTKATTTGAVTDGQTNETLNNEVKTRDDNAFPTIAVTAGVVGVVVLILIVIAVIIFLKRKYKKSNDNASTGLEPNYYNVDASKTDTRHNPHSNADLLDSNSSNYTELEIDRRNNVYDHLEEHESPGAYENIENTDQDTAEMGNKNKTYISDDYLTPIKEREYANVS